MPISAIEILASNLERRGLTHGEKRVSPRLCDLPALPAGDHRQGRDGLRGRAAGRRGRRQEADRHRRQEALRREVPGSRLRPADAATPRGAGRGRRDPRARRGARAARRPRRSIRSTSRSSSGSPRRTRSRSPTTRRSPSTSRRSSPCPGLRKAVEEHFAPASPGGARRRHGARPRGPDAAPEDRARGPRLARSPTRRC